MFNNYNYEFFKDIELIKNKIINYIKLLYKHSKVNLKNDINLIYNIYNITYIKIKTYVNFILNYDTKYKFIVELKNMSIKSHTRLNEHCTNLITDVLYIEIYTMLLDVNYNHVSLSF